MKSPALTVLSIGSTGTLVGGAGDVFRVSGSFVNENTQAQAWDTSAAALVLTGGGALVVVVSEPGTGWFALAGLVLLGGALRRARR
jgi:hypothetical protein